MQLLSKNGYTLYRTMTRRCACYIIETVEHCVLVDTSMRFEKDLVAKSIDTTKKKKIDAIFLTHSHTDHVANAQCFSDVYHCKTYISEKGIANMKKGCCAMPKGTTLFSKLISKVGPKIPFYQFTRFQACPAVQPLNDEIVRLFLGESSELIETPGHTNDSVSILFDHNVAIVGDAMVNNFENLYPPFADDEKAIIASWDALLETQCKMFFPAHGNMVHREKLLSTYKKAARV